MTLRKLPLLLILLTGIRVSSAQVPRAQEQDFVISNFRFASGETLPELRLHYRTLGKPQRDARAWSATRCSFCTAPAAAASQYMGPGFAGELFQPGGLLDAERFFLILPDSIGHGQSSKPSDGLRARFPRYGYVDMVGAQHRLVTEGLGVNHLRLVMGASMGGMHTWLWGERYPEFHGRADAAGQPADADLGAEPGVAARRDRRHSQRSRVARGNYEKQPPSLRTAAEMLYLMGSNPVQRQRQMPTLTGQRRRPGRGRRQLAADHRCERPLVPD